MYVANFKLKFDIFGKIGKSPYKPNFLKIVAENNFFNSSYFLWLDIGAVRHEVLV